MSIAASDHLEVVCKLNFNNVSEIRNVFHLVADEADSGSDASQTLDIAEYMSLMYAEIEALLSNNVNPTTIQVINLTQDRIMGEIAWPAPFVGGTATSDTYALGVAAVIRLLTVNRGHQGRKFFGALAEGLIGDDALFVTSAITMLAAFGAMLLQPIELSVASLYFAVYDRVHNLMRVITEVVVNAIPGYQKRRKQGVGI